MHLEILQTNQKELLPYLNRFEASHYLVGGTAIALQIGHRRSIDFDLFTKGTLDHASLLEPFRSTFGIDQIMIDEPQELTFSTNGVKLTFLAYPFSVEHHSHEELVLPTPDLVTLGALKAYALGRRGKWKDYVDLYFILQKYSIADIVKHAQPMFGREFDEKLFRVQLSYFDDIDYSEQVMFMPGFQTPDNVIRQKLEALSIS